MIVQNFQTDHCALLANQYPNTIVHTSYSQHWHLALWVCSCGLINPACSSIEGVCCMINEAKWWLRQKVSSTFSLCNYRTFMPWAFVLAHFGNADNLGPDPGCDVTECMTLKATPISKTHPQNVFFHGMGVWQETARFSYIYRYFCLVRCMYNQLKGIHLGYGVLLLFLEGKS